MIVEAHVLELARLSRRDGLTRSFDHPSGHELLRALRLTCRGDTLTVSVAMLGVVP